MTRTTEDFAQTYSRMSDEELLRINQDRGSLLTEAIPALDHEIAERKLSESSAQAPATSNGGLPEADITRPAGSSWWMRAIIFFVWSFVGLAIVIWVFGMKLSGDNLERFTESATKMFIESAIALSFFSQAARRWLTVKRTMIVATVIYTIGIGAFAIALNLPDRQLEMQKQIGAEMAALGPSTREFRGKLGEILQRQPETFDQFQDQTNDLENLLDSDSTRMQKVTAILGQAQEAFAGSGEQAPPFSLLQKAFEDDAKTFSVLREEIACAHVLSASAVSQQSEFRTICIDPAQNKIRPLVEDEETIAHDFQEKGYRLPADIQDAIK